MTITFIGTGSARTVIDRFHSAVLVKTEGHQMLVDAGDGVSKAFINLGADYNQIDSILLSHFHPDHVCGLPNFLNQMKLTGREKDLKIYVQERLAENLEQFLNINLVYLERLSFNCEINPFRFDEELVPSESLKILPKQNGHLTKSKLPEGYEEIELNSASFLISSNDKKVIYTADIGEKEDLFLFGQVKPDYYIVDSQHVEFEHIYNLHKEFGYKNILLTHIDFDTEHDLLNRLNQLPSEERLNLRVAFDGLVLE
jgi:ribonuclease BN (tRNA processing enzyme)